MREGFGVGRHLQRTAGGDAPVFHGVVGRPCFGVMMRQNFGLDRLRTAVLGCECGSHGCVQIAAVAFEQAFIGCIAYQRMLEREALLRLGADTSCPSELSSASRERPAIS